MSLSNEGNRRISIKFLMSNGLAGSLIGTGGKSIKELMTETEARVLVSAPNETFPGTSDRVVLISGTKVAVSLAQTLIWELIAINAVAAGNDEEQRATWVPKDVLGNLGDHADIDVAARISIPASAGGLILGKGGSNIRQMAEESGAKVTMSNKDEALFTQERVLSVSGKTGDCVKCIDMAINKLCEEPEVPQFIYRGTSYNAIAQNVGGFGGPAGGYGGNPYGVFHPSAAMGMQMGGGGGGRGGRRGPGGGPGGGMYPPQMHGGMPGPGMPMGGVEMDVGNAMVADTTITLAVPNDLVGNIFGRQGATLREIISLSGAKVTVSPRNEYVEGTTNRTVTITGNPVCAHTAHMFIAQRLQNPSVPPPRPRHSDNRGGSNRRGDMVMGDDDDEA